jgi:hypothetical protein
MRGAAPRVSPQPDISGNPNVIRQSVIMMWLASAPKVMGDFVVTGWLKLFGWVATVAMALAVVAMIATSFSWPAVRSSLIQVPLTGASNAGLKLPQPLHDGLTIPLPDCLKLGAQALLLILRH